MKTSLVAHLALTAFVGVQLGTNLSAQQDEGDRAPRPRAGAAAEDGTTDRRPRGRAAAPLQRLFRQSEPPRLGVTLDEGDDGLRVTQVEESSLAQRAGVQVGDLLLRLDGEALGDVADIRAALAGARPGQTLALTVVRDGQGIARLEITLPESKPEAQADAAAPQPDGHKGGFLGVELGEPSDAGVVVSSVLEGTAAWFAGLEDGDVLRSIDGHAIEGPEDVVGAVSSREPGSMVTLSYARDGKDQTATVRLGHRASQAFGMLQPGSGMVFPQMLDGPDGNVMVVPGQGQGRGAPRRFQFFGGDGKGFTFDGNDFDWQGHLDQLDGSLHGWMQQLHEQLEGLDLEDGGEHSIGIRIEDGVMTIDKDGEKTVIDLDDSGASAAIEQALENVNLRVLPGLQLQGLGGAVPWAAGQPDVRVFRLGTGDGEVRCEILMDGCPNEADTEAGAEAEALQAPPSPGDIL